MLLEVCNKNFLFLMGNESIINILYYAIIFLCLLVCFIVKNKKNGQNKNMSDKLIVFISSFIFLVFACLIVVLDVSNYNIEGCYSEVNLGKKLKLEEEFSDASIGDISGNKIVIVGDSRMEFIENDKDNLNIPINFSFIAKSGAKIQWLSDMAVGKLQKKLDNLDEKYSYHVVINMGVNDLNQLVKYEFRVRDYYRIYKSLMLKYPNINFYLLSVNPVDEDIINKYWPSNIRTNKNIKSFNTQIVKYLEQDNFSNAKYCDSYNYLEFNTYDGLHYDRKTNQKIINYISDKCINYKKSL